MTSLEGLRDIIPPDRLFVDPAQLKSFESDGLTAFKATPRAVVLPETSDEVVAVVRWLSLIHI